MNSVARFAIYAVTEFRLNRVQPARTIVRICLWPPSPCKC